MDVYVFCVLRNGDERRWFHSWGEAVFDAEAESKSVSVKLGNGKLVEFR